MEGKGSPAKRLKFTCSPAKTSSPSRGSSRPTYTGYIQKVTSVQKSSNSTNHYFDISLQVSDDEVLKIRVMVQSTDSSLHRLFQDKSHSQQPVILSSLSPTSTGTIFFNNSSNIQDAPAHSVSFKCVSPTMPDPVKITDLLEKHPPGDYTVSGLITWKDKEPRTTGDMQQYHLRDAKLTDSSGIIDITIWAPHFEKISEGKFYTFNDCKLRVYNHKKSLSTSKATTVTDAPSQDLSSVPKEPEQEHWICCPNILNVAVNTYPVCNNKDCRKKITTTNTGSRVVQCQHCNRNMLLTNCYLEMNINFHLEKDETMYQFTAFHHVVTLYLDHDVLSYKDNMDDLVEKLLSLEKVDFKISKESKLINEIRDHSNPL